jgi:deoxyribose-phosphate aldolase
MESKQWERLKRRFDTSIIEPQASDADVEAFIDRCLTRADYFAGLAFNLHQVPLALKRLEGKGIAVAAPLAYPLGGLPTELKVEQVRMARDMGAQQIDVCMALEALRANNFALVEQDAAAVVEAAGDAFESISLIPNTAFLIPEQEKAAAGIVKRLGATYKTNAGFGPVTTLENVLLVRREYGETLKIMVSGGCRTAEQALAFFEAGADKIATSTPFEIFWGLEILGRWETREAG